jgi:hypothetical protein
MKLKDLEPRRFPTASFISAMAISLLATVWLGWSVFHAHEIAEISRERSASFERIKGEIIHLDEVLTMSARMAAATGDLDWEQRYRRFEPQLDAAIKRALSIAPGAISAVTATQEANEKLLRINSFAFDLVRSGQRAAASAMLFSDSYETHKSIYAQGMAEFIDQVQKKGEHRSAVGTKQGHLVPLHGRRRDRLCAGGLDPCSHADQRVAPGARFRIRSAHAGGRSAS